MQAEHLGLKILIIDDDEDDFFITSEYIRNIPGSKFKVEWCYDYNEAIKLICSGEYELFFVDYFLGAKTADNDTYWLHHPQVTFNEDCIRYGAPLLAEGAMRLLRLYSGKPSILNDGIFNLLGQS